MEIAKLVLEYWKASVWPLVFVIAVLVFRDQIRDALKRAKTFDAMGVSVELAEGAQEAHEALDQVGEQSTTPPLQDGEPEAVLSPVSRKTSRAAARALQQVTDIQRETSPDRPTGLGTEGVNFRLALLATAFAFGAPTWTDRLAAKLAEETGNPNWKAFAEAAERTLELPVSTGSAAERRLVHRLTRRALDQLAHLLEQVAEHPVSD
ncbi:hypothetical protein [Actinomadura formosensis]|uniref:hypothetical protein n=1 Tax=Actinomadura formosensis TaxID=60706 RepID=UPI003D9278A4